MIPGQQPASVDATFYAQLEPVWRGWGADASGNKLLDGGKVVAITQKRPDNPRRGTVTVKLTLRVPAGAFLPLAPEAIVVIPESMTVTTPVEVEAQPAGDPS